MGTSKNLSNYTDVRSALGTHSSMFTEQVLVWIPVAVILLRKVLQGILDLSRSVQQLFLHRFLLRARFHINNSTKHQKLIFFHTNFF